MRQKILKIINIFVLVFILFNIFGIVSVSATKNPPNAKQRFESGLSKTAENIGYTEQDSKKAQESLATKIGQAIKMVLSLLGVLFLGLIIYAGYIWMLAQGNEQEVSRARSIITNAIIGLAVVLAAYAITAFVGEQIVKQVIGN